MRRDVRRLPRAALAAWLAAVAALGVLEAVAIVLAIENARGR